MSLAILFRVYFLPHLSRTERETVELTTGVRVGSLIFGLAMGVILGITSVGSAR